MKSRSRPLAALLALVPLAACASFGGSEPPPPCPRVAFVYGLHTLDSLEVNGRPLPVRTELADIRGTCAYTDDGIELDYNFAILARPGAPLDSDRLAISYFVTVLDDAGQVADRQRFRAELPAVPPGETTGVREFIRQTLGGADRRTGPAWQVLIGFDLPPDAALQRWQSRDL